MFKITWRKTWATSFTASYKNYFALINESNECLRMHQAYTFLFWWADRDASRYWGCSSSHSSFGRSYNIAWGYFNAWIPRIEGINANLMLPAAIWNECQYRFFTKINKMSAPLASSKFLIYNVASLTEPHVCRWQSLSAVGPWGRGAVGPGASIDIPRHRLNTPVRWLLLNIYVDK